MALIIVSSYDPCAALFEHVDRFPRAQRTLLGRLFVDEALGRSSVRPIGKRSAAVDLVTVVADQRFPLIGVIPATGTSGEGALYPALSPGGSGLKRRSYALVDHVRSVDKRRIQRAFGTVTPDELGSIDEGLALFLGLTGREGRSPALPTAEAEVWPIRCSRAPSGAPEPWPGRPPSGRG